MKKYNFDKLIKTACNSIGAYKVSAMAISKKGNILGYSFNKQRFMCKGGGIHAEQILFKKYQNKIHTIYITRVNNNGDKLPIEPCKICNKIAKKLNIKIMQI